MSYSMITGYMMTSSQPHLGNRAEVQQIHGIDQILQAEQTVMTPRKEDLGCNL